MIQGSFEVGQLRQVPTWKQQPAVGYSVRWYHRLSVELKTVWRYCPNEVSVQFVRNI